MSNVGSYGIDTQMLLL